MIRKDLIYDCPGFSIIHAISNTEHVNLHNALLEYAFKFSWFAISWMELTEEHVCVVHYIKSRLLQK